MNVSGSTRSSLQSTQQPTQLQRTEQMRAQTNNEVQDAQQLKQLQADQTKPVANSQGQMTGRLLNVSAWDPKPTKVRMATITATNSATPSLQASLLRSRIAAARREAEQAESYAETLRRQVDAQENVVEQRQRRVKAVENSPQVPTSEDDKSGVASPRQDPTYINTLAEVFQAAKPILESDLSAVQKSVVKSDLLERTNHAVFAPQTKPSVATAYQAQVFQSPSQVIGRVLNASA